MKKNFAYFTVGALAMTLSLSATAKVNVTYNQFASNKPVSKAIKLENSLNSPVMYETNVVSPVYVNTIIKTKEQLIALSELERRPANVIFYVDENLNLCDPTLKSLGITFKDAYTTYMKTKMLPVMYIANESIKNAVKTYLDNEFCPVDFAICSDNYEFIKEIRTSGNGLKIRSVLDYSTKDISEKKLVDLLKEVNISRSTTIILSDEAATEQNIEYFNARLKTVWVNNKTYSDLNTVRLITDGIYGIITDEYEKAISSFEYFKNSQNAKRNINRYTFNIAHRGLCYDMPENSLEGYIESFKQGATHIETDVHLSKDKKIVVMHDYTLDRTTTGKGTIAEMTYDEISKYKITKNYSGQIVSEEGVKIPTLEDLFKEFKGNGKVLVVEIKDYNPELIPEFKKLLDQYDMYDQVVCISFANGQLVEMRDKIPEVPCATLNNYSSNMFNKVTTDGIVTFNQSAFGPDLNASLYSEKYDFNLAARGFPGYYWTYDNKANMYTAMHNGVVGMTNNRANSLVDHAIKLATPTEPITVTTSDFMDFEYEVDYINYKGEIGSKKLTAKPIIADVHEDYADVILAAEYKITKSTPSFRGVYFSDVVRVKKDANSPVTPDPENPNPDVDVEEEAKGNNLPLIIGLSTTFGVLGLSALGFGLFKFLKKKKK